MQKTSRCLINGKFFLHHGLICEPRMVKLRYKALGCCCYPPLSLTLRIKQWRKGSGFLSLWLVPALVIQVQPSMCSVHVLNHVTGECAAKVQHFLAQSRSTMQVPTTLHTHPATVTSCMLRQQYTSWNWWWRLLYFPFLHTKKWKKSCANSNFQLLSRDEE